MYLNYLKSGFRNLYRNKLFSVINITGFSIGLAVFFLIVLWINYEVGFDRFHKNAKNIYRVVAEFERNGIADNFANTPAPLGPALKEEFPNVLEYTRCTQIEKSFVTSGNNQFWENLFFADEGIFKVFSLKLRAGNIANILTSPSNVIVSQQTAKKYFGDKNPIGKTISIGINNQITFTIAGILEDAPSNSQFKIDFLLPFNILSKNSDWGIWNYTTYILLDKQNDYKGLQSKLQDFTKKYQLDSNTKLHLQPFVKIHLFSNLRSDLPQNIYYPKLILYVVIAVIVLLLASINFINLSLAKTTLRIKEIGIRKVIGANNKQLRFQFLSESFIITLISFILSIPVIYYLLPLFNQFINKDIALSQFLNYGSIAFTLALLLSLTLINGLYPASVLSSVNPAGILRGNLSNKQNPVKFARQAFIIFQFVVALFFISGTLIIKSQLNFIEQKNLGFDKEHIIIIPVFYTGVMEKGDLLAGEIRKSASVKEISFTSYMPAEEGYNQNVWWEGMQENRDEYINWISADENFISLMGIKLLHGRNFDKNLGGDKDAYIINERAQKIIGWKTSVGKFMDIAGKGEVIGVVDNFNFKSLHNLIEPVAIKIYPDIYKYLYIKTLPNSVHSALKDIRNAWSGLFPGKPFEYTFLEDNLTEVYKKEANESEAIKYMSIFAILIASMGILGLSSLLVTNRTKEIGIRKVNGARISEILNMLIRDLVKWVAIAFVIATPLAYFAMYKWLGNFAYKTPLSWWIFAAAGMIALVIALLTVSLQSWRAATRNPVESLRYE